MVWFSQWSHGQPWVWAVGVVILLMIHEIGHIAAAYIYGGQWLGFQGTLWGIGVRLDLSSSPPRHAGVHWWPAPSQNGSPSLPPGPSGLAIGAYGLAWG